MNYLIKIIRLWFDAFADMFTKEAIYAYLSTFSEVGWWFGGAKTKVTIVGFDEHSSTKLFSVLIMDEKTHHND